MIVGDQSEVLGFLEQPESYRLRFPDETDISVTRIDTHGAAVFLVGPLAFKMKRAVYFEYMDFSTLERRHQCCLAELVHNRRTSQEIYKGVVAVLRRPSGELALATDNGDQDGEIIEWLVEMHRFDENSVFDRLALRGELDTSLILQTADMACDFFERIEVRDEPGICDTIPEIVEETARQLVAGVPDVFSTAQTDDLVKRQRAACEKLGDALEQRRIDGFVRLGHGDLHLRNICLFENRPMLFDAIEFNDRLAISDVLYDLAFLLMDLLHRGLKSHANLILNRYLERTGDDTGLFLLPLYLSVRAGIRAFTAIPAAASQSDPEVAARVRRGAVEYLELAAGFLHRQKPGLVAVGGLSGSGKSTLAKSLAPCLPEATGAVVLRSDVIRKSLFGKPATEPLGPEGYKPEVTAKVYAALNTKAAALLAEGQSVIVDAVHARPDERDAIEEIANNLDIPFNGFWLEVPESTMVTRLQQRKNDASDADVAVLEKQLTFDAGPVSWTIIDGSGAADKTLQTVCHLIGVRASDPASVA